MGGRGSGSGSAKQAAQRELLRAQLERRAQYADSGGAYIQVLRGESARTALNLMDERDKLKTIRDSDETLQLVLALRSADIPITPNRPLVSTFKEWMEPGTGNMPLFMTREQWAGVKDRGRAALLGLNAKGISLDEAAAYLMYERYFYSAGLI